MTRRFVVAVLLTAGVGSASAQTPAPAPAPGAAAAPAQPAGPAPPTPPANYAYTVDSRRDPFVALLGSTGKGKLPDNPRAEGLAGIVTDEVAVRGILQSQGRWVAMVAGPAGKVYTVRPGDKLADGTIRGITPQFVVILQQVDDPLSLEKQREVRKFLRGGENK
jgi:Tfp pilus assembly protein PilP